jgi:hypothetical protein
VQRGMVFEVLDTAGDGIVGVTTVLVWLVVRGADCATVATGAYATKGGVTLSVNEELMGAAAERRLTADEIAYVSALVDVAYAAKLLREKAAYKAEQPQQYVDAADGFDAAWDALDHAARKIGRSIS